MPFAYRQTVRKLERISGGEAGSARGEGREEEPGGLLRKGGLLSGCLAEPGGAFVDVALEFRLRRVGFVEDVLKSSLDVEAA